MLKETEKEETSFFCQIIGGISIEEALGYFPGYAFDFETRSFDSSFIKKVLPEVLS